MVRAVFILFILCIALTAGPRSAVSADQAGDATVSASIGARETLTVADSARLEQLKSKKLHQMAGHHELAEFMDLNTKALKGQMPSPAEAIADYALMSIGQPYKRKAMSQDLAEADCVTFTERCIALACAKNWSAAHLLQSRLRFKDGDVKANIRNREPILDWIPNNAWLFDEITDKVGVTTEKFDVIFEKRTAPTTYIAKDVLPSAYPMLQTGDILLVIAEQANPPSDPQSRMRCVHLAFVYKPANAQNVQILHSYPPRADQWPLERLLKNRNVRGGKILRIKPDARQIVETELLNMAKTSPVMTPVDIDSQLQLKKGKFGFTTASRAPDSTTEIGGVRYGVIKIRSGETLWKLFGAGWKGVSNLDVNKPFLLKHPKLDMTSYEGETIYYPISLADGEKTLP